MRRPLISVGITCHNASDTISRAVMCALEQTWPELEVLVVDDASTDSSWPVLQALAASDRRVRIKRHHANTGVAGARATILAEARGEFLAYFDDDDTSVSERLEAQFERLTHYERRTKAELVFCYSDRAIVRLDASAISHIGKAMGRLAPEPHGRAVADYILAIDADPRFHWGLTGSCTMMARTSAYLAAGGFDAQFRRCGELDLAIRAALLGGHFIAVDRPLVTQYKTRSADKSGKKPLKYALLLRTKHRAYLQERRLYWASRMLARSNFYKNRGHSVATRAYKALALVFGPALIISRVRSRGLLPRREATQ